VRRDQIDTSFVVPDALSSRWRRVVGAVGTVASVLAVMYVLFYVPARRGTGAFDLQEWWQSMASAFWNDDSSTRALLHKLRALRRIRDDAKSSNADTKSP